MQDAKEDTTFDPRRNNHKTGKDGKFVAAKNGSLKPKNALTVTYLCFALDVPYATFKRWKLDSGVSATVVPFNKGKCVLTDKTWASKLYNARRMFIKHSMSLWLEKHPAKKNDTVAKKVCFFICNLFGRNVKDAFCYVLYVGKKKSIWREMENSHTRRKNSI